MRNPLSRKLSFKLIWESYKSKEVESRRLILQKGRMESRLHIILKVLAFCYFWDRNLIIEPRFPFNRYKPDLISWQKSEIPTKEELIPDLWIECKAVNLKKLIRLSHAFPQSSIVWMHSLQPLSRTVRNIESKNAKYRLALNLHFIGIETAHKNWILLEESMENRHIQWVATQPIRNSIMIEIKNMNGYPIPFQFHDLLTTIKK
ncbi:MAG: hypothetical protein ACFFB5_04690 [Promethearchaeota archaeon]